MATEAREVSEAESEALDLPIPFIPLPRPAASGLYTWSQILDLPHIPIPVPPITPLLPAGAGQELGTAVLPLSIRSEELRLDVDGRYPQMMASGRVRSLLPSYYVHWIAKLSATAPNTYSGPIWYKDGSTASFLYTSVRVVVTRSIFPANRMATVSFFVGAVQSLVRTYRYSSPYFHKLEFEYDSAAGTVAVTTYPTHSHPDRPATLPSETLSMETVFRRSGFDVSLSPGNGGVPIGLSGAGNRWSDNEMHDAMIAHWSRFANKPQWAAWVFFASLHESGTSLGGIMFDDIGPNERQGTAIFEDAFISVAPAGDAAPAAWVNRMRFWTAVHETGHTLNLAHSWQKSLGVQWIPLANEPEARSFMNYPYFVSGGVPAFFNSFQYRFSDPELLFMRHAPERFVQQGNAAWFDHHGFELPADAQGSLQLEVRLNRDIPTFEFMEPAVVELKLKNVSSQPQLIPETVLMDADHLLVMIKKQGSPARQYVPYARYCLQPSVKVLMAGEAAYESLFIGAGKGGWIVSEPGDYMVQVMLHINDTEVLSNELRFRVRPPAATGDQVLAQDYFTDDVGRVLNFDGSRVLTGVNATLREVVNQMGDSKAAVHAAVALAIPMTKDYKVLSTTGGVSMAVAQEAVIQPVKADMQEAHNLLSMALQEKPSLAAESLGHIDYKYYVDTFTDALAKAGDKKQAADLQTKLQSTLASRGVLARVLGEIKQRSESYR